MASRIVIDPVTRIEGHLRIEIAVQDGVVTDAFSSGTMVRGFELILKGRDPRDAWAFVERACGVCTTVHALASVRAVEDALGITVPPNADLIRNLMFCAQYLQDHVVHFYHLHALDWVDVVSALSADPVATSALAQSISSHPKSSPGYFAEVQAKVKGFVDGGQLGIFANGYWGHPGYKLPPEANLMAVAHYLEALAWQREVVQIHAIFGGKNPHPNFLVGGSPSPISLNASENGGLSATALNMTGLGQIKSVIEKMKAFVDQVYVPDTLAIASFYKDWFERGEGVGNFMTFGDFPETGMEDPSTWLIPAGVILDRDLSTIHPINFNDPNEIQEFVSHSYYDYSAGKTAGLHPYAGETQLNYTGPKPPFKQLNVEESYSWLKSPRWKGHVMEVGPLARVLMMYARGNADAKALVDSTLAKLELPVSALFSTMGRTAARTLESKLIVDKMSTWYDNLVANIRAGDLAVHNDEKWDPATWPSEARGVGLMEAPRGALSHWIVIKDGKIDNYQAVVPSTWNAGPRDANGVPGPYEAALMDRHNLHDPKQPLEIQRTIHSFDPCLACAVHVVDPNGEELVQIKVS